MLLKEFHQAGDKVLLFSFSTQLLDVIEAVVQVEGYVFDRLDGSTPQEQRGLKCSKAWEDDEGANTIGAGCPPKAAVTCGTTLQPVVILQRTFLDWTPCFFTAMAWIFIPAYCSAVP